MATVISRWQDEPLLVRGTATFLVIVLAYGAAIHVVQLIGSGFQPYPDLPGWMRTYFISLAVLDPLAAVLVARRLRSGVVLALAVLVSDAIANGWANYALDDSAGITGGRIGHAIVTVFAIGACLGAPRFWRIASPVRGHR